jgi:hypothetical protein
LPGLIGIADRRGAGEPRGGLALAAGRCQNREQLRPSRAHAFLVLAPGHEPARVRRLCRTGAEPHQSRDEVCKRARPRPRLYVELDGGILRAGAVGETARVQLLFKQIAPRAEVLLGGRTRRRLRRHCADDREQPLAAPWGQLGLATLVQKAGDGNLLPATL